MAFIIPIVSVTPLVSFVDDSEHGYYDMFTDQEIMESGGEYIGNDELFGLFRLRVLEEYKRTEKQEKGWKKILEEVSKDRDVEYIKGDTRTTVVNIMKTIPEGWIKGCLEYLNMKGGDIISRYVSDEGLYELAAIRNGKTQSELMDKVGEVIQSCPKTTDEIVVIRGIHDGYWNIGDKIITQTPKSASFGSINCEKHTKDAIMRITIPKGKRIAYNESEDQIIYPQHTKLVVDKIIEKEWRIGKYKTYCVTME